MSGKKKSVNSKTACFKCKNLIKKGEQYWVNRNKNGKEIYVCDVCVSAQSTKAVAKHIKKYGDFALASIDD